MKALIIAATALSVAAPAAAETVQHACVNGNVTRAVEVVAPGRGDKACEVIYRKPQEGVMEQVLWDAGFDAGFCAEKADVFVAKLQELGWECAVVAEESADEQPIEAIEEQTADGQPVEASEDRQIAAPADDSQNDTQNDSQNDTGDDAE